MGLSSIANMSSSKTQIAIEYAFRVREESAENKVLWVYGADAVHFKESYRAVASLLGIPGADSKDAPLLTLVRNYLSQAKNGPWLLVLDNVDDISVFIEPQPEVHNASNSSNQDNKPLKTYLPISPNGRILITSRNRGYAHDLLTVRSAACLIEIPLMTPTESLDLLRHRLSEDSGSDEDEAELVSELEHLPLAIDQAAAYIIQDEGLTTVSDYLQTLRRGESSRSKILMEGIQDLSWEETPKRSVLRAWDITFEHIQRHQPKSAELFFQMSIYSSQAIPADLLQHSIASDDDLNSILRPLLRFHLVKVHSGAALYDLHGFIQLATRTYLKEVVHRDSEVCSAALHHLLASFEDAPKVPDSNTRFARVYYLPHAQNLSDLPFETRSDKICVSNLLSMVAAFCFRTWDIAKTLDASSRSLEILSTVIQGEDDLAIAMSRRQAEYGHCLTTAGRHKEGEKLMRTALDYYSRSCEGTAQKDLEDFEHLVTLRYFLGYSLFGQGRYSEAREEISTALELSKAHPTIEFQFIAKLQVRMCQIRFALREFEEVEEMARNWLRCHESKEMTESQREYRWQFQQSLIEIYGATGRHEKARMLLDEVQPLIISHYGEKSYEGLSVLRFRAAFDQDLDLICHTLTLAKENFGSLDHVFGFSLIDTKLVILRNFGRYEEAAELGQELVKLLRKAYGSSHVRTMTHSIELADNYLEMGQFQNGLDLIRRQIEVMEDLAESHLQPHLAAARFIEAKCLAHLGQGEVALSPENESA